MKILDVLSESFLFSGIEDKELLQLIERHRPSVQNFKKNEPICSAEKNERRVGFVISGLCEVCRERSDGSRLVLNLLKKGDSFGILSVFSEEEFPTTIFAAKSCEIIFFEAEDILELISISPKTNSNLISFMAGRIAFLNRKIATFSANSVEERLAALLLDEYRRSECDRLPFSFVKIGEEIGAGRASVYRAVDSLSAAGIIEVKDKKAKIIDPKGLERIIKK